MENKIKLNQLIEQVWNNGNLDIVEGLIAPQYTIYHDPGDPWEGQTLDRAAYKERVLYSRNAFPDLHFAVKEFVPAEDKIAISWYLSGTHDGELAGVPASGKQINVSGISIYYFSSGKITGHWQVIDQLAFMVQIGMYPPPENE